MSTLEELRSGLGRVWNSVAEGWRQIMARASGALTRFRPGRRQDEETAVPVGRESWGLLTADVFEEGDKLVVRLEAPGMEADDFDITVLDNMLVVRGEKRYESQRQEKGYHIAECAYGVFERAIPLPLEVDGDQARAKYRRGVLRVELPKHSRGRRIHISAH